MANRRQNMQRNSDREPTLEATDERYAAMQTVFPWHIQLALYCWKNITIFNILKCFSVICLIAAVVVLLMLGQPILHAYFSAYDITIINRLNESCTHSLCRKNIG